MVLLACVADGAIIRASNMEDLMGKVWQAQMAYPNQRMVLQAADKTACKAAQKQQNSLDNSQGQASASLVNSSLKWRDAIHHEVSATT